METPIVSEGIPYFGLWGDKTAYEPFNWTVFTFLGLSNYGWYIMNFLGLNLWWEILVTKKFDGLGFF